MDDDENDQEGYDGQEYLEEGVSKANNNLRA
jgi:hypothetical protein